MVETPRTRAKRLGADRLRKHLEKIGAERRTERNKKKSEAMKKMRAVRKLAEILREGNHRNSKLIIQVTFACEKNISRRTSAHVLH